MGKQKIFTLGIKFTYDLYKNRLFRKPKFIFNTWKIDKIKPILANNLEEAVDKFKTLYNFEKAEPSVYWENDARNIIREVIEKPRIYTIEELQKEMNSDDFLAYCRQELTYQEQIINFIK